MRPNSEQKFQIWIISYRKKYVTYKKSDPKQINQKQIHINDKSWKT